MRSVSQLAPFQFKPGQSGNLETHGAPGQDVMELYTSFGWATLCKQVAALQIRRAKAVAG